LVTARHAEALGIVVDRPSASIDGLRHHKESVVGGMVSAHRRLFADSGMDFVMGVTSFVAERTVEIRLNDGGIRRIRGRDVVVNTGTMPTAPAFRRD
jgi:pyruvate/2-oxoglutarate dehydrogenase complex dihydrolipoamide dehydrogenase (E3) component